MLEAEDATDLTSRPEGNELDRRTVRGIVTAISKGYVEVATRDAQLLCTVRGKVRRGKPVAVPTLTNRGGRIRPFGRPGQRQPGADAAQLPAAPTRVAPGDDVLVLPLGSGEGVVEDILPRRSVLQRSAGEAGGAQIMLANLDHAVLAFAVRDPPPHWGMLDRYLALCEHAGVASTICLNKVDLGLQADVQAAADLYRSLGYRVLETSAVSGEHVVALAETLRGRVSLITGPSGVGKSSLINCVMPEARLRTGATSAATGKGRHTTTGVRLLRLEGGGWLADSAGIRELALWHVPPDELARCFVELREIADDCAYENCGHGAGEEGCALRLALAQGRITSARWASYERLLHEARATLS